MRIFVILGLLAAAIVAAIALMIWMDLRRERQYAKFSDETLAFYLSDGQAADLGELFAWLEKTFPPGTPGVKVEEFFTSLHGNQLEGWWITPARLENLDPSFGEEHWWVGAQCMSKFKGLNEVLDLKAELDNELKVRRWSAGGITLVGYHVSDDGRIFASPEDEAALVRSDEGPQ